MHTGVSFFEGRADFSGKPPPGLRTVGWIFQHLPHPGFYRAEPSVSGESPPALPGGETWRKSGETEDLHHFSSK